MAEKPTIVVRRVRKARRGGHHGGAWKVAYADFVTAMMAFFLVLWLLGATTPRQRAAISEYFRNPSPLAGESPAPSPGMNGPGGASSSMIKLGGTMEIPRGPGRDFALNKVDPQSPEQQRQQEKRRLEALMRQLQEAIGRSQALEPFKDQLLLDLTPEGLRIQIVDQQNRPMFDIGSARLKDYTSAILRELARFINQVPNHISITGHTDTTAYSSGTGYGNWELSADRANAARRTLVAGGMEDAKVVRVVGLSSSVLFDKADPHNPINRRISIVVMTHAAEQAALAGSGQPLALGPAQPDADTRVPELRGDAPAPPPEPSQGSSTPPARPAAPVAASGTGADRAAVSTAGQVAAAASLARAAEVAARAQREAGTPAQH
ncbi:flagellar motor protein MotB [[Pseudomonas] boreopolis]|uniref:flagellar motor protein MotB n=1 Tax=Xanthomonas boreopolis TaxID=86183 RepID=UPI003D45FCA0